MKGNEKMNVIKSKSQAHIQVSMVESVDILSESENEVSNFILISFLKTLKKTQIQERNAET